MHAPTLKRTPVNQIIGVALILGLLLSVTLGIVTYDRIGDNEVAITDTQQELSMLAKEQRSFDLKLARLEALEEASGAQYIESLRETRSDIHGG